MLRKITIIAVCVLFFLAVAGYVSAGQGKSQGTANGRQISAKTRIQSRKQIQVDKNCSGPQYKTQTRKRTNYLQ